MLLITGAAGYLGSVLVDVAVRQGIEVRAAVRDPTRARALLPEPIEIVVADLGDPAALLRAAEGCSGVLHAAGRVAGTAADLWESNVEGTRRMLDAAAAAGVQRFVQTSSSAAIMDAEGLLAEQPVGPPALTDPYSASKAAAERLVLEAAEAGLGAMIVNPTNIYGPSPRGPQSYNGLFRSAAAGEITMIVDAEVGWVLAEDVAIGQLLTLHAAEPGRRYVLCGEVASFGQVLNTFADLVGGHQVRTAPPGSTLPADADPFARRSEVYGMFPPVRVRDAGARGLGFAPCGIADGLARTAAWISSR